ncbi:MAG TPA: hypothetical protein VEY30_08635 [Myxococcaceae bacterium]|nr:hypothetical protein [Myxococcaceae bacterium]
MSSTYQASGTLIRGYCSVLTEMKVFNEVCARLSRGSSTILTHPPLPSMWVPVEPLLDVIVAIEALMGAEVLRQVAFRVTRESVRPIVGSMAKTLLAMFGTSPASIYERMAKLAGVVIRGLEYQYTRGGPSSGRMEVRMPFSVPTANFVVWEGTLRVPFALCGVEGTVAPHQALPGGVGATFAVSWTPK